MYLIPIVAWSLLANPGITPAEYPPPRQDDAVAVEVRSADADVEVPFLRWVYPNAEVRSVAVSQIDGTVAKAWGHYAIQESFRDVVAFYGDRSVIEAPNHEIIGREYPTDQMIDIPAALISEDKGRSAMMLYSTRGATASVTLLEQDLKTGEVVSIAITRGRDEDVTSIQISWLSGVSPDD